MVFGNDSNCPICNGRLKYYDRVKRIKRTKNRVTTYIYIDRVRCVKCNKIHRLIPTELIPYKQYESEVIFGVKEGLITSDTLGYEDYPCEETMKRWRHM